MALPASGPLSLTDIQTEFGGTNPISLNEYYAGGGLVPAGTTGTYGAVPSSGTISVQNFYGTTNFVPVYIEDVFSTYVYTGNGATLNVTNGINLTGSGGLVWIKSRSDSSNYILVDTVRGASSGISSNLTAPASVPYGFSSFASNGFVLSNNYPNVNQTNRTYVSWTFRKQPKFFDIVQYSGNATARTIAHNLGSVPKCILVKDITFDNGEGGGRGWKVYHVYTGESGELILNSRTGAVGGYAWNNTVPTSSVFSIGNDSQVNSVGSNYIAYLFAGNAGGFGLTGNDNAIVCGGFQTNSSGTNANINLGWEPQWVMYKKAYGQGDWKVIDTTRQMEGQYSASSSNGMASRLDWNAATAEAENTGDSGWPFATGFGVGQEQASTEFIYIAIRKGPMKIPTVGTSVFTPLLRTGTGTGTTVTGTSNFVDLVIPFMRNGAGVPTWFDRLRGKYLLLRSNGSNPENYDAPTVSGFDVMNGFEVGSDNGGFGVNVSGQSIINWCFTRAPSFFDIVCYRGNNEYNRAITHNLAAVPELVIVKNRTTNGSNWAVYSITTGLGFPLTLNSTAASSANPYVWGSSAPTSTTMRVGDDTRTNATATGQDYVMYLFATAAGVSKVGSYTGSGALQTVNCGFTTGARFVFIKRTDSTGGWYVWDSARGITSGNDPYLKMNSTAAEVTGTNYVDTTSVGFQITAAAPVDLNEAGGTFIFLAVA